MAYENGWTPIVEFQLGTEIEEKYNNAFGSLDTSLDDVNSRLVVIENNLPAPEVKFSYSSNDGLVVSNEAYDDSVAVNHTVTTLGATDVMYGYSLTFTGTVSDKLWIEMTVPNPDGTAGTPFEHVFEVKDSAEVRPKYYAFPRTHTIAMTNAPIKLRFRKGTGDANFTVSFIDLMTEIKS